MGVLIIILSSVFGSNGVNTKQVNDIVARAQEITRVSTLVSQQSRDGAVLNLAATTSTALTSDEKQLIDYLSKYANKKINAKDLNLYLNRKTDAQIQAASSTNTLSTAYYGYLKNQLTGYQNAVRTAATDDPATIRPLLQTALNNAQTILSAQEIATAQ